jgi:ribonuclease VapC
MIIDTSAIIAIFSTKRLRVPARAGCPPPSFVEASIVTENSRGYDGLRDFDLFLVTAGIEIVPVDVEQARTAREAFRRFGKGRHAAALNFGDRFSYALAKTTSLPLLFKGNDFSKTDIQRAI